MVTSKQIVVKHIRSCGAAAFSSPFQPPWYDGTRNLGGCFRWVHLQRGKSLKPPAAPGDSFDGLRRKTPSIAGFKQLRLRGCDRARALFNVPVAESWNINV